MFLFTVVMDSWRLFVKKGYIYVFFLLNSSSEGIVFLAREENSPRGRTGKGSRSNAMISLGRHAVVFQSGGEDVPQLLDEIFHHLGDNAAAWYLSPIISSVC